MNFLHLGVVINDKCLNMWIMFLYISAKQVCISLSVFSSWWKTLMVPHTSNRAVIRVHLREPHVYSRIWSSPTYRVVRASLELLDTRKSNTTLWNVVWKRGTSGWRRSRNQGLNQQWRRRWIRINNLHWK